MNTIETLNYRDHEIKLAYDPDSESPRDWDNVGTFITWLRSYNSPDKNEFPDPHAFKEWLQGQKDVIVLPVYFYAHGQIAYRTRPFSDPWDSGQAGYIYCSREKALEAFGGKSQRLTKSVIEKVKRCLMGEVENYSKWANGEVYGYMIEGKLSQDSCWGYYGLDEARNEAKARIDYAINWDADEVRKSAGACHL